MKELEDLLETCDPNIRSASGGATDSKVLEPSSPRRRQALGGLLTRKERWTLSLSGKLVVGVVLVVAALVVPRYLHPFLALTSRANGEILIVDGWIPTYTLERVVAEFKRGSYQEVLVVRGLFKGRNKYESGEYVASYLAEGLVESGIPKDHLHIVSLDAVQKDRTYSSAIAVKKWAEARRISLHSLDVITLGVHARRSRLLFQKAFGNEVKVGVIAMQEQGYDPIRWWRTSEGVREVPFECVAYLYVKLLFRP